MKKVVALALVVSLMAGFGWAKPQKAKLKGTIKIGFFSPLTGFAAADGLSALRGAKLAVEQINKNGGLLGKKVILVNYDDRVKSSEAVAIARKLVTKDRVVAAVSGSYSGPTRAAAPIFQQFKVPMISAYAVHPEITKAGNFIFRNGFLGTVEGKAMGEVALKFLGAKRIALLVIDNDYGHSLAEGVKMRIRQLGGAKIVYEKAYSIGEKDFTPLLTAAKAQKPDLLIATAYYNEAAQIARQVKQMGWKIQILGEEGYDSPKFLELAGDAAEGVIITTNLNRDDLSSITQNFIKNFKAKYNEDPDMVGASSYDAVMLLAKAIKKAHSTDPARIRDALQSLQNEVLATGVLYRFTNGREVVKPVQVQIVKNGEFHYYGIIADPDVVTPPW